MKKVAWILSGVAGALALVVVVGDLRGTSAYVLFDAAAALLLVSFMMHYLGRYEAKRQAIMRRFMERGIDGQVTLERIVGRTGQINGNPQQKLQLTVRIKGKKPYKLSTAFSIHRRKAPGLEEGKAYQAKINPDDPEHLLIPDWVELA